MFRSSSESTINVPKSKSPLATKDINIQTEPISDKGFGVSCYSRCFYCNQMDLIDWICLVPLANGTVRGRQRAPANESFRFGRENGIL